VTTQLYPSSIRGFLYRNVEELSPEAAKTFIALVCPAVEFVTGK